MSPIVTTLLASSPTRGRVPVPAPSEVQPFFTDDFAGAQKNPANGVIYETPTSGVSVVSFDGYNCLRFRYGPNATGAGQTAEQRISLGQNMTEFGVRCYVHIPATYAHRTTGTPAQNNKMIRVWGDNYGYENKVGASAWPQTSPGPSYMQFDYTRYGASGTGPGLSPTANGWFNDDWQDRWNLYRWYFKHTTSDGANDGMMKVWRDDTLILSFENVDQEWTAQPYWNAMYLFGAANSGFTEQTDFHVRELSLYNTNPGWG